MESIGEKLRLARERGTYTLEQVARDTHVARRFLKALEDEDFSVFPGETYAMGFLRTYAEYLGLDADELVALYRNIKIQEQPLPMTELLDTRARIKPRTLIIAVAAGVVLLGVIALVLVRILGGREMGSTGALPTPRGTVEEFVFEDEVRTRWFAKDEVIVVPLAGDRYRIVIAAIADTLTLKVPGGTAELALGRERLIDLDADSRPDLKIVWNDVDKTGSERRVHLGLYRVSVASSTTTPTTTPGGAGSTAAGTGGTAAGTASAPGSTPGPAAPSSTGTAPTTGQAGQSAGTKPAGGSTTSASSTAGQSSGATASASQPAPGQPAGAASVTGASVPPLRATPFRSVTVASAPEAEPFKVDLLIRGNCLLRYQLDGGDRQERFFQRDEQFSLDAKARMILWLSNAGVVRATVEGKQVDLGRPGEVGTRTIAWRNDAASGSYVLEIAPLF